MTGAETQIGLWKWYLHEYAETRK